MPALRWCFFSGMKIDRNRVPTYTLFASRVQFLDRGRSPPRGGLCKYVHILRQTMLLPTRIGRYETPRGRPKEMQEIINNSPPINQLESLTCRRQPIQMRSANFHVVSFHPDDGWAWHNSQFSVLGTYLVEPEADGDVLRTEYGVRSMYEVIRSTGRLAPSREPYVQSTPYLFHTHGVVLSVSEPTVLRT